MDLDQALHIERDGEGYTVYYAIADVAAFITPGDPIDLEANRRGETLYGADSKVPLHPKVISEGAGSLLPDQVRPALLWQVQVDATGEGTDVKVERALVRSRAEAVVRRRPEVDRPGRGGRAVHAARGDRRAATEKGSRARWCLAAAPGAGDRRSGRPMAVGVPRSTSRRAVERPDLAAGRDGCSIADGLGPGRAAAHASAGRPARRTTPPSHCPSAGHRVARRAALPRLHPLTRPDQAQPCRDGRGLHAAAPRLRLCRVQRRAAGPGRTVGAGLRVCPRDGAVAAPRGPVRRRDLRRPVCRRRRSLAGSSTSCQSCPTRCGSRPSAPITTRTRSSTWSRRPSSRTGSATPSTESSSRSTGRTAQGVRCRSRIPRSRPLSSGSSELPLGTDVRVKLVQADVDSRQVAFALI